MPRTLRTRRLAILTASAALAAGGALIPTTALAAPASAQAGAVSSQVPHQETRTAGYGGDSDCWGYDYGYGEYADYYYRDSYDYYDGYWVYH
ncbi:hypothetical protein [Actinacidiphila glaucinigra]|uniref:hypothetical protein n=1 Tax=Actinacidiphila glaucinigra TaxID=235986 RepID=UPI002E31C895|nr:hypothetical protein [Actinacidiphila glaucinigra]